MMITIFLYKVSFQNLELDIFLRVCSGSVTTEERMEQSALGAAGVVKGA